MKFVLPTILLDTIQYADQVDIFVYVLSDDEETFSNWMTELTNGQAVVSQVDQTYLEFIL